MPEEPLEERTEEPTPRRREEARKRGQIVKSRELSSVAIIASGFFTFLLLSYMFFQQIYLLFYQFLTNFKFEITFDSFFDIHRIILYAVCKMLFPFFIILSVVAIIVYLLQTGGGVWASEVITFNFDRINPVEGFKRLFSLTSIFELFKSLVKLAIITGVSYWIISKHFREVLLLLGADTRYITFSFQAFLKDMIFKMLIILAVLSVLDWLYNRWDVERRLKLTRQELKEELKQTEGDPWLKSKIRQKQREIARRRMLAEVPMADVVVTYPVHYAVALKYEFKKMPAPQVVAKGKDFLAQKIKEIAEKHNVPIYEDPPLARLLYEKVEVGEYIPEDLYQVVAKVLAYVYKLKNKKVFH